MSENMDFDKSKVKMNSPLIILSFSQGGTAGSLTDGLWVALNSRSVPLECGFSMMVVYRPLLSCHLTW